MKLERELLFLQNSIQSVYTLHSGHIVEIVLKINKTGEKSNPDWNDQESWPNPKQRRDPSASLIFWKTGLEHKWVRHFIEISRWSTAFKP